MNSKYFEDFAAGMRFEYGPVVVDEAEMLDFARRYDPQSFHVDAESAARGAFGGLIASGWFTAALMMRQLVDHYLAGAQSLGSPGIDELRWLAPVRAGDRLQVGVEVLETRRSQSKPDRGIVRTLIQVTNQRRETVMSVRSMTMMLCRDAAPAGAGPGR